MNAGCALYASVGPVLHRYVLDARSSTLAWQKSLRMPEAVQFAWPSPTGRGSGGRAPWRRSRSSRMPSLGWVCTSSCGPPGWLKRDVRRRSPSSCCDRARSCSGPRACRFARGATRSRSTSPRPIPRGRSGWGSSATAWPRSRRAAWPAVPRPRRSSSPEGRNKAAHLTKRPRSRPWVSTVSWRRR